MIQGGVYSRRSKYFCGALSCGYAARSSYAVRETKLWRRPNKFGARATSSAAIPLPRPTSPAGRASNAKEMLQSSSLPSVETRTSWIVATAALGVMAIAFGAPWVTVVALKDIAAEVHGERAIPAFAAALVWVGSGLGGVLMGRVAERVGVRWTVIGGSVMIAAGLALSTLGPSLPLYIGHGLGIGLLGIGGINAPFYIYVSRWFDRRRGSALALISSGSFLAGTIWPPVFERAIAYVGWRHTMLYFAALEIVLIVPAAGIVFQPPPEVPHYGALGRDTRGARTVMGWPANLVYALMACAIFTCCVPMSMPQIILLHSAAIWASALHMVRRWYRCCWGWPSSAGSSGAPWPMKSAAYTPCLRGRRARPSAWWRFF